MIPTQTIGANFGTYGAQTVGGNVMATQVGGVYGGGLGTVGAYGGGIATGAYGGGVVETVGFGQQQQFAQSIGTQIVQQPQFVQQPQIVQQPQVPKTCQ